MAGVRRFKGSWKRITKNCTNWAFYLTVIWLVGAVFYVGFNWCKFLRMEPNALGDFLAGTFSPLALFWLVAGYMQQGKALRLNTHEIKLQRRALLLQHKELAEQVKATLKVATHSEQQADASAALVELSKLEREDKEREQIMKIQPQFALKVKVNGVAGCEFELSNYGVLAQYVSVRCLAFNGIQNGSFDSFLPGITHLIHLGDPTRPGTENEFTLSISYVDGNGTKRLSSFMIQKKIAIKLRVAVIDS